MEGGERRRVERNGVEWGRLEWIGVVGVRFVILNNTGKCLVQVLYHK